MRQSDFAFGSLDVFSFFTEDTASLIRIQNPLGEEMSLMRPSLIPALLGNLSHNLRHGEKDVRLYELANTFTARTLTVKVRRLNQKTDRLAKTLGRLKRRWSPV